MRNPTVPVPWFRGLAGDQKPHQDRQGEGVLSSGSFVSDTDMVEPRAVDGLYRLRPMPEILMDSH